MRNILVLVFVLTFGFISCPNDNDKSSSPSIETFNFSNLDGNDIYLVKVNKSGTVVNDENTGGARILSSNIANNINERSEIYEELPFTGNPAATEFNANPLPFNKESTYRLLNAFNNFVPPDVGDTRNFWVETAIFGRLIWTEKQATLRATGTHGNIWVMDENYSPSSTEKLNYQITTEQAEALSDKFDLIYPAATNILGFEYGGGPNGDGGVDDDPKIQILVYDIDRDNVAGYFWGKDLHQQSQLDTNSRNAKTNLAEIIYLDASETNNFPDYMYSLMIHELQHFINYSVKWIKHGKSSATWYNEMLSAMAEDIIAPMIGVNASNRYHSINQRMRRFLVWYDQVGITEWNTSSASSTYNSYSKGFAFGAYLLRNYGGAELLKRILANNTTNIESISSALNELYSGMNFEKALVRFGETMIYSGPLMPEGVMTFDKSVTNTINGYTYTAYGFDIYNDFIHINDPLIFNLQKINMRPHLISVHSVDRWKNISGNISISLEKSTNNNLELYLLVK